jgi:hypothetical protein
MKRLLPVLLLLAFTGYAQDSDAPREVALGEAFHIKIGEKVAIKDTNLKITFIVVLEDTRCPEDVFCGVAGNAKLKFKVKASETAKIKINLYSLPRETVFRGYKIQLTGLSPNRRFGQPIPPESYEATMIVTNQNNQE